MPRLPRVTLPGQPHHVIQRGNNRSPIFIVEKDYRFFRRCLLDASLRHNCSLHAYVFMTNHIHLLLTPDTMDGISKMMQSVGRRYVQYFNSTYDRTGTLWEGRFRSILIESENYLFICHRYIELNPVRANMVGHPAEYRWSSYHANALGVHDRLVQPHYLYTCLGSTNGMRQQAYKSIFSTHVEDRALADIRTATQKGWVLGSDGFKDQVERLVNRRTRPLGSGGDHRSDAFQKARLAGGKN